MATTPPPPSFLRIPPTPRHGTGYDQYEPYSTRHSARLANQRSSVTESRNTPPPTFPISQARTGPRSVKKQKITESETLSPPGSPASSPRKKRSARSGECVLGASHTFTAETSRSHRSRPPFTAAMTEGMLPTPAKTPRKKAVANVGTTARTLFPQSSGLKKKSKKHTGFSLDSFTDDSAQNGSQIQIYTDSRDRIPEVDESEGNPFFKKPSISNTNGRTSKRKPGARDKEVDEALKREDGMVYVFRGKKMFRKFNDNVASDEEVDDDDNDLGLLASRPDLMDPSLMTKTRPLTRSSIKPRVLFPTSNDRVSQDDHASDVDEEAATDVDDNVLEGEDPSGDVDHAADVDLDPRAVTPPPKSTVATPPSPGGTVRSLRSRGKRDGPEHGQTPTASESKKKRISPFDGWLRKKQTPPMIGSKAKKRDAETAAGSPGGPVTKRTRGNRSNISSS